MSSLVAGFQLIAQDTVRISRDEAIEKGLRNNLQLKAVQQQTEISKADYQQSEAIFLPSVIATQTSMFTNNPLMAFGSKLNQERISPADFDPNRLNDPDRTDNFAVEIQVLQPLLNLDGVYMRQAAKIQMEARELQAQRTGEYLEMEIAKAYMQLQLAYEAVEVLKRAQLTADAGVKLIGDYFYQGLVKRSDVLDVQVRQMEVQNQLAYAQSNVRNASDYLATILGETPDGAIYLPDSRIAQSITTEQFSNLLPESRKDVQAMDLAVSGYEKMIRSNRADALPRINAFGSYQVYDDNPLGFGADGYLLGLQISWNVFDGKRTIGKVQKARAELQKATFEKENYLKQSQMELNRASRQLADAGTKVELYEKAYEQKTEAYQMRQDRFKEGLEKTADLLMAETQMFQKELEYLQAIFEYNLTKEYLRFLTK